MSLKQRYLACDLVEQPEAWGRSRPGGCLVVGLSAVHATQELQIRELLHSDVDFFGLGSREEQ